MLFDPAVYHLGIYTAEITCKRRGVKCSMQHHLKLLKIAIATTRLVFVGAKK